MKVARIYTECTYSQNIQFVYQKKSRFAQTGAASLGNDDVSSLNACMESLGNDDVSLQNVRKYLVDSDCDVIMTRG